VPKGGVIRNKNVHRKVLATVKAGAEELGYEYLGETKSPITGKDGNIEYFMHLRRAQ